MATLQTVRDRIASDYLNRSDLNSEAVRAIQAAIRHYEMQRWPWNETTTTLTCVSSQSYVDIPEDFLILDRLEVQFQSTNDHLIEEDFGTIQQMNIQPGTSNNVPTHFAIRANRFELASIPDSAYLINCYYIKKLPELSAVSDTNKWLSAAEDLIVHRATKMLWADVLKNEDRALVHADHEREALSVLRGYRTQRFGGRIKATRF